MFPDGRDNTMVDCRGMRHDMAIGAWERRWSPMRQWCVDSSSPTGQFDMLVNLHVDKFSYVRSFYTLF